MTFEEMKELKKKRLYTNRKIAELSGVPLGTVQKIFSGETKYPRLETMAALERVLKDRPQKVEYKPADTDIPGFVRETEDPYSYYSSDSGASTEKKQGTYTVDDYRALPEWPRYELIDGVLYQKSSPTTGHQRALAELAFRFMDFIRSRNGSCDAFFAPLDVQLDCDDYTMVQPDFLIVCNPEQVREWGIWGAPDFVLEILSPSSKQRDMVLKLKKYEYAGVREYWIVDLEHQTVLTYAFGEDPHSGIYGFGSKVPVGIYDGELEIDLAAIFA